MKNLFMDFVIDFLMDLLINVNAWYSFDSLGAHGRAHLPFGMTPTSKIDIFGKKNSDFFYLKKGGRTLGTFLCNPANIIAMLTFTFYTAFYTDHSKSQREDHSFVKGKIYLFCHYLFLRAIFLLDNQGALEPLLSKSIPAFSRKHVAKGKSPFQWILIETTDYLLECESVSSCQALLFYVENLYNNFFVRVHNAKIT